MQAVMSHPVAIAITWLLVEHIRDLGRQFVGVPLVYVLGVRSPQLGRGQDGRKLRSFGGGPAL